MFVKVPRLPDSEIVRLYTEAGESAGLIGLRAKVSHAHIMSILRACGVPIRTQSEAIGLGNVQRRARAARKSA